MNLQIKMVKDLKLGDEVYLTKLSKSGDTIGWECIGYVVKLHNATNCMGSLDHGNAQYFRIYNEVENRVKCYYGFEHLPLMVKSNESL